jgi:hypothetical protein
VLSEVWNQGRAPNGHVPLDLDRASTALKARARSVVTGTIFDDPMSPENRENLLRQTDEICNAGLEGGNLTNKLLSIAGTIRLGRTPSDRPARRTRPMRQIAGEGGTRRLRQLRLLSSANGPNRPVCRRCRS